MLLPALNKVREQANMIVCQSNMRQIGQGMAMYLSEHRNTYPQQTGDTGGWTPLDSRTWWGAICPYIGWNRPYSATPDAAAGTIGHCPSHFEQPGSFSYVANWHIVNNFDGTNPPPFKITKLHNNPAEAIWLWELHTDSWWPNTFNAVFRGKRPFNPPRGAHGKVINYLFCDGHVAAYPANSSYPDPSDWEFQ
jgi:prepilin-type processing-associated H-X9-DG protein